MIHRMPSETDLILVAVMNNPRDLEIARLLGWYRIPLRSAPKVISVDWLAFYQTAAFPNEKWQVRRLAPVQGHELTTRAELLRDEPDHPHARQEYFKIQLGPLTELSQPIRAEGWRRVTFFYTTGAYLLCANTLNDLILPAEEREMVWHALHKRATQESPNPTPGNLPGLDLDPQVLAALLGIRNAAASPSTAKKQVDSS